MAGSGRYTVILHANVLYPNVLRNLLLSLASAGLYHARWTQRINEEWTRNLLANRPDIAPGWQSFCNWSTRRCPTAW